MRTNFGLLIVALAAALTVAGIARATVTVSATVAPGSTLSVSGLNSPTFTVTLNGDDQTGTYLAHLQVVDARGLASGGGWNLSASVTQFSDGAGHTLGAQTLTSSSVVGCHTGSTCALPTNTVTPNTNLGLSSSATKFMNATNATGLGRIDIDLNASVAVPASTIAATYSSTLTIAVAAGP